MDQFAMELASKLKISSSRNSVTSGVSDAAREEAIASISSAWENMPGSDMTVSNRAGPRLADYEDNRTCTGTNGSPPHPLSALPRRKKKSLDREECPPGTNCSRFRSSRSSSDTMSRLRIRSTCGCAQTLSLFRCRPRPPRGTSKQQYS
jgi:hypothetical protein